MREEGMEGVPPEVLAMLAQAMGVTPEELEQISVEIKQMPREVPYEQICHSVITQLYPNYTSLSQ